MRKLIFLSFITILSLFLIASLDSGMFAATTGKIQGTITDEQSKELLPGVNVVLEGTTLGAATNANGFFFIINIPPGTYSLKASIVGYAVETKSDVRVYVDRTTITDFQLKTQAIAGQEVTVTAERAPVPLDVSSTEAYISGLQIAESAARFDEMIGYQAGVEYANTDQTKNSRGFSIRGGGVDETDVQIDGFSIQNKATSGVTAPISRNLIQDVQILTGGFNAEYGNAGSGLINVITKDGSFNRYSGVLEYRYSPKDWKHFGMQPYNQDTETGAEYAILYWSEKTRYAGVKTAETYNYRARPNNNKNYWTIWQGYEAYAKTKPYGAYSKEFYYEASRWLHRPLEIQKISDMMTDVSGGGPVPFLNNTKFYGSFFWNRATYPLQAPRNSHEYNATFKITRRIKSNMTLVATGMSTTAFGIGVGYGAMYEEGSSDYANSSQAIGMIIMGDDRQMYSGMRYNSRSAVGAYGVQIFEEGGAEMQNDRTYTLGLKLTHTISPKTYYDLSASAFLYDSDRYAMGMADPTIIHWIHDAATNQDVGFNEYPRGGFGGGTGNSVNCGPWIQSRITEINFDLRIGGKTYGDNVGADYQVKGNFVSQVNKYNQIKGGFQLSRAYTRQSTFMTEGTERPITSLMSSYDKYTARPWQLDTYLQDKLEWEGMVLNFGLRTLTFFPGQNNYDLSPEKMFGYDENGNPLWDYAIQWGVTGRDPRYIEYDGNWQYQEYRTVKMRPRLMLQPRIGISHPITNLSKIFFNYGHFYYQPVSQYLYSVNATSGRYVGNPGLKFPKLISYEIGYSQSIYNQILVQISGYYKDYTDNVAKVAWLSYYGDNKGTTYANLVYRDIRGLEFRVERSFGRFINGWANYNYRISSSGVNGFSTIYEDFLLAKQQYFSQSQVKPQTQPTFRMNISLRTPVGWGPGSPLPLLGIKPLAEWKVDFLFSWQDGGKYLWNSNVAPREYIYVDRVNRKTSDLYLSKRLTRGLQFYGQVKNLFNNKRLRTNDSSYRDSLHLWFEKGTGPDQKGNDKIGDYKQDYIFISPFSWIQFVPERRDVYFGLRYQF
jgi:hypothetical protein